MEKIDTLINHLELHKKNIEEQMKNYNHYYSGYVDGLSKAIGIINEIYPSNINDYFDGDGNGY
jgi:hypothetical protein